MATPPPSTATEIVLPSIQSSPSTSTTTTTAITTSTTSTENEINWNTIVDLFNRYLVSSSHVAGSATVFDAADTNTLSALIRHVGDHCGRSLAFRQALLGNPTSKSFLDCILTQINGKTAPYQELSACSARALGNAAIDCDEVRDYIADHKGVPTILRLIPGGKLKTIIKFCVGALVNICCGHKRSIEQLLYSPLDENEPQHPDSSKKQSNPNGFGAILTACLSQTCNYLATNAFEEDDIHICKLAIRLYINIADFSLSNPLFAPSSSTTTAEHYLVYSGMFMNLVEIGRIFVASDSDREDPDDYNICEDICDLLALFPPTDSTTMYHIIKSKMINLLMDMSKRQYNPDLQSTTLHLLTGYCPFYPSVILAFLSTRLYSSNQHLQRASTSVWLKLLKTGWAPVVEKSLEIMPHFLKLLSNRGYLPLQNILQCILLLSEQKEARKSIIVAPKFASIVVGLYTMPLKLEIAEEDESEVADILSNDSQLAVTADMVSSDPRYVNGHIRVLSLRLLRMLSLSVSTHQCFADFAFYSASLHIFNEFRVHMDELREHGLHVVAADSTENKHPSESEGVSQILRMQIMEILWGIYNVLTVTREEVDQTSFNTYDSEDHEGVLIESVESAHAEIAQTIFSSTFFPLLITAHTFLKLDNLQESVAQSVFAILTYILQFPKPESQTLLHDATIHPHLQSLLSYGIEQPSKHLQRKAFHLQENLKL